MMPGETALTRMPREAYSTASDLVRRAPQAQQVPGGRELTRVRGLPGADVLDGFFRGSIRNVCGHGDEIFHGQVPL
jgi:hypothetical protein